MDVLGFSLVKLHSNLSFKCTLTGRTDVRVCCFLARVVDGGFDGVVDGGKRLPVGHWGPT